MMKRLVGGSCSFAVLVIFLDDSFNILTAIMVFSGFVYYNSDIELIFISAAFNMLHLSMEFDPICKITSSTFVVIGFFEPIFTTLPHRPELSQFRLRYWS